MNHGPIVVSEDGFKVMTISADFKKLTGAYLSLAEKAGILK